MAQSLAALARTAQRGLLAVVVAVVAQLSGCSNELAPGPSVDAGRADAGAAMGVDAGDALPPTDSGAAVAPDASTGVGCMREAAFACDAVTPGAHVCMEYTMGDVSTYAHSCMVRGGRFITYCPHADAYGACEIEGGVLGCQRRFYYGEPDAGAPDAATVAAAMATCAASDPMARWVPL